MERVLSVYLPAWDVELIQRRWKKGGARREREWPAILLVREERGLERVVRCCAKARRAGVSAGMSLAEARAVVGEGTGGGNSGFRVQNSEWGGGNLHVERFDAGRSGAAMEALAKWCWRYSPVVAVDCVETQNAKLKTQNGKFQTENEAREPDGLLLDVTGVAHLFGGEHLMMADLREGLARMGFQARLAIGPTVGAAWGLARFGREAMVTVGEGKSEVRNSKSERDQQTESCPSNLFGEDHIEKVMAALPVGALRIDAESCFELEQVGVRWIGDLLRLKREDLRARFGDWLLMRLDQALGRKRELIVKMEGETEIFTRRVFEGETTQLEAVMAMVKELIAELCGKLLEKESGVRQVKLELKRTRAMPVVHEFVLGRASRDAKHLWELMRVRLEKMHMGHGVEAVEVKASWHEKLRHMQEGAWGKSEMEGDLDREFEGFLDVVVNRWGSDRVCVGKAVESYVPERAMGFVAGREARGKSEIRNLKSEMKNKNGPRGTEDAPREVDGEVGSGMLLVDRPGVLMAGGGEPVEVVSLLPDRPPSWMRWRGEEFVLRAGMGPERVVTEWWKEQGDTTLGVTRDYFTVQTAGGSWLWVYRELETGKWFVQGQW